MNNQIKAIFFKEIKETLTERKFVLLNMTIIMLFTVIGFLIDYYSKGHISYLIIILSPLSMWILSFPLIKEKFINIKDSKGFHSLLSLPLSLQKIWIGKITAIFILSYPSTALITVILTKECFLIGQNPFNTIPQTVWLLIFIIGPIMIMIYNSIISGIALRFDNLNIQLIHELSLIFFILIIFSNNALSKLYESLYSMDWTIIVGISITGMISIMYCVTYYLSKEKVII